MLQRKTPLARGPGPKRKKGLCAQSRAARRQATAQRRAYQAAGDAEQAFCSACGKAGPVEHSHLFSQKAYPEYRNTALNWMICCRACHELFEHKKADFACQYPRAWQQALEQMKQVDYKAYCFFRMRHSYP